MSDLTFPTDMFGTQNVRRGRTVRRRPADPGKSMLQPSSRLTEEESRVLAQAQEILLRLSSAPARQLTAPHHVREYLITLLAAQEREYFVMVSVDNRHRVIASEVLFAGTIDGSRVYPREVVKSALRHNAAAVIFAHNHPSQILEPSQADELITRRLKEALELVDIRVLDHFVIGGGYALSFCEKGLL